MKGLGETSTFHRFTNLRRDKSVIVISLFLVMGYLFTIYGKRHKILSNTVLSYCLLFPAAGKHSGEMSIHQRTRLLNL